MAEAVLGMRMEQFGFTASRDAAELLRHASIVGPVVMIPANLFYKIRKGEFVSIDLEIARMPHAQGLVGKIGRAYVITDAFLPPAKRWRDIGNGKDLFMVGHTREISTELQLAVHNIIFD